MSRRTRRQFLLSASAGIAAIAAAPAALPQSNNSQSPSRNGKSVLSGIQISPWNFFDEGIGPCLDFIQETAAIDAIFCYSQSYHFGTRPPNILATDHPVQPRSLSGRKLPYLWMKLPREPFRELAIQHETPSPDTEFTDRDIFRELVEPCRKRGIRIYARILEAGMRRAHRIPGYTSVRTVTVDGNPGDGPCWNHPDYREWIRVTVEQMMKTYPLDGLQYGAERVGPLSDVLFRGAEPSCFCRHCIRRNEAAGIDTDSAREGYRQLHRLMQATETNPSEIKSADGVFAGVLRILMRHPEVLAWYRQWFDADQEIQTMVYRTAKAVSPAADVGQHVDHQRSTWDVFYRAAVDYRTMAAENDFIKPILYHDILGPRLREWVIDRMQQHVLADMSRDLALELFYALFGHDSKSQPGYEALATKGLTPEYVARETERCVRGVDGLARVYAGIGFDVPAYVPGGMERFPSQPETTRSATLAALHAGADGVVASREYEEMSVPNLRAFGDAVRSFKPA